MHWRCRNGRNPSIQPKPVFKQSRPHREGEITLCQSRAVRSLLKEMNLGRNAGANQRRIERNTAQHRNHLVLQVRIEEESRPVGGYLYIGRIVVSQLGRGMIAEQQFSRYT